MVHHLTPKKVHIYELIFFSKCILLIISEQVWESLTKSNIAFQRYWRYLLLRSTMGMPGMPDHTQEKIHDQTVAYMDILLHAKSKRSTSNSF